MTDPREEIKRTLVHHYGRANADAAADALLPLFLRERERAETAEGERDRAIETRENANTVSVRVEGERDSWRRVAERLESEKVEARARAERAEAAEAAIRADERERLSARVYENGWCGTCGRVSDEPAESNFGRSVSDLSRDDLLGVAIRNLNEGLDQAARADRAEARLDRALDAARAVLAARTKKEADGDA